VSNGGPRAAVSFYRKEITMPSLPAALTIFTAMPACLLVSCAGWASAQTNGPASGGQAMNASRNDTTVTLSTHYLLYLPVGYEQSTSAWPLVLFLHGAGERGDDLDMVKKHGPPKRVEAESNSFPFILVAPQCPAGDWWASPRQVTVLDALLNDVAAAYRVDPDRVYVTGLSMGGFGTWALACEYPDRFAAIAPVCGGGEPGRAARIAAVPTWVFHGAQDGTVPLARSEEMLAALKAAGGNPKFTVYPEAGHDSWTATYANPELYDWLLSHKRPHPPDDAR
jgi:predicted peptidase